MAQRAPVDGERGSRRRRLAAMAGTVYRAGVAAASEIREQYNSSSGWVAGREGDEAERAVDPDEDRPPSIPGAFPQVPIATSGDAQMMLFPNYAMRHQRRFGKAAADAADPADSPWQAARREDEEAVLDVYVHGWIYLPQRGALTRKNRLLIGLARRLSGLSAAAAALAAGEQQRIAREAEAIERRGQGETAAGTQGQYSETAAVAAAYEDDEGGGRGRTPDTGSIAPRPRPPSPAPGRLTPRLSWATAAPPAPPEMSEAELATANAHLLARIGPFLTTPVAEQPVTLFFYSATQSQSRTVQTSAAGHFSACMALDFVPTHVRVLVPTLAVGFPAGEPVSASPAALERLSPAPLSAVAPVHLVEDDGVSLISDIDDTVKASNVLAGTREMFRSTFVRDLGAMAVDGTREWYGALQRLGVQFHYCSNSPWQLYPMLATFLAVVGLPAGPLHLKQYSGMLQGIFEPVAERKRATLERLLRDFPHRRFLLVGDSGEADLEVYTDLVLAHPRRVLAIFIRDVTTPDQPGYFDATTAAVTASTKSATPPPTKSATPPPTKSATPPPPPTKTATPPGPVMGHLIDLDDDPPPARPLPPARKPVPQRPSKPAALRGATAPKSAEPALASSLPSVLTSNSTSTRQVPPPPPPRRVSASSSPRSSPDPAAEPPRLPPRRVRTGFDQPPERKPSTRSSTPINLAAATAATAAVATQAAATPNRKVDMWRRRLAHAEDMLEPHGVALYTWRRGQDVMAEAIGIVKAALQDKS